MRPCEIRFWTVLLLIAAVLYLGSIVTAAFGAVEQAAPNIDEDLRLQPDEHEHEMEPCDRPPERPRLIWWMIIGPNGEKLIVGAHEVRQRC